MRDVIGSIQHEIWSHWMKYLFSVSKKNSDGSYTIPKEKVDCWKRQINTSYWDLPDKERKSDREQADKVIDVIYNLGK